MRRLFYNNYKTRNFPKTLNTLLYFSAKMIAVVCLSFYKGVLITFGANATEVGKQASLMAEQILQGVNTKNIPVEIAEFYLGINLKTAEIAETPISNNILASADFIIPHIMKKSQ